MNDNRYGQQGRNGQPDDNGRAHQNGQPGEPGFTPDAGQYGQAPQEPGYPQGGWYGQAGGDQGYGNYGHNDGYGATNANGAANANGGHYGPSGSDQQPTDLYGPSPYGAGDQSSASGPATSQTQAFGAGQFGQPDAHAQPAPYGATPSSASSGGSNNGMIFGIVGVVAGLLIGGLGGYFAGSSGSSETVTVTETASAAPASGGESGSGSGGGGAEPAPSGGDSTFGDGTFLVGTDIQPGMYRTAGTDSCYWARLSGTTGSFDEIIANEFGGGQQIVSIAETDVAFESKRCGTWEKTS